MKGKGKIIAVICAVVAVIIVAVVAIVSINSKPATAPIVGKWKYDGSVDYVYTFNEDGSGDYSGMEFTYQTNGNKISIDYKSGGTFETEYEINGSTLNVKDSAGKDTLYKKV